MSCKFLTRRVFLATIILGLVGILSARVSAGDNPKTKAFTFVQLCDPQLGFGGYEHDIKTLKQAAKQINALKPDFVVICGDLVNDFDEKSVADFIKIKNEFTVPCYCAAGNHDVGQKPTAATLKHYREAIGKDYYSLEHKGYTFVFVNTSFWKGPLKGESEKHDTWLSQTLKKAKDKCSPVFIVGHYPLFLEEPKEKDNYYNLPLKIRKKLLTLYKKYGVVAVLAGHTHSTIINNYDGIQLIGGESTSKHGSPLGFRLWTVTSPTSIKHEAIPLKP